jgi:NitT/TauT family transport system permease protein
VVVVIVGWQWFPDIPGIRNVFDFADPFFISSPSLVVHELWALASGQHGTTPIWAPLAHTVLTALLGSAAACVLGAVAGLAVSNWTTLDRITRPFLVVLNAIPRIAMIPIIVLLARDPSTSDALTALTVVFFLVFYNAAAGASSVPAEIVQNAELMGASKLRVMWRVRWPYAMGWTLITLPNAIAFGLVGAVTAEIFTGSTGLGYDLVLAIDNSNATLLFAIVVVLAIIGVILVLGSSWLRRVLMPWWESSQGI